MRFALSVRGVAVGLLQLIRFSGLQELEEAKQDVCLPEDLF